MSEHRIQPDLKGDDVLILNRIFGYRVSVRIRVEDLRFCLSLKGCCRHEFFSPNTLVGYRISTALHSTAVSRLIRSKIDFHQHNTIAPPTQSSKLSGCG